MAQKTLKDSLRRAQERNAQPVTRQGEVVSINPIARTAKVRLGAGTAPTEVLIQATLDPTTLRVGMVADVNVASTPNYILAVIGGTQPTNTGTAMQREINALQTRVAQLEAQMLTVLEALNTGKSSARVLDALYNQLNAGAGGATQEIKP